MANHDELTTALTQALGAEMAQTLVTKLSRFTNSPGAIKSMAKWPSNPAVESGLAALLSDPHQVEGLGLKVDSDVWRTIYGLPEGVPRATVPFWGLMTLAARADLVAVTTVTAPMGEHGNAPALLAAVTKGTLAHTTALLAPQPSAAAEPNTPQKVSQAKAWLAAHPEVDPAVLAPTTGQKAGARLAAVRALGTMGTPEALAVLAQYASPDPAEAMLKELHTAWANPGFDRREFAAALFTAAGGHLDLDETRDLTGIGAIADLTSLSMFLIRTVSLAPLSECARLQSLFIGVLAGSVELTPLAELPELTRLTLVEDTQDTDLGPLAGLPLRSLRLSLNQHDPQVLLDLPALTDLELLAYRHTDPQSSLATVVLTLVARGVRVTVHHSDQAWLTALVDQAQHDRGMELVAGHRRYTLTRAQG